MKFYHYNFRYLNLQLLKLSIILLQVFSMNNLKAEWIDLSDKTVLENIYSIKFINADTGFCVGSSGSSAVMMTTTNGGKQWMIKNFQGKMFIDLNVKNKDTFFISGYSFDRRCGILLRCFDFGENIEEIYFNDTLNPFSFGINKTIISYNNRMFLCGFSGAIFYSHDFGKSWMHTYTGTSTKIFTDIQMINDNVGYAVAGDSFLHSINQIYKTIDSGMTWEKVVTFDSSFNVYINSIYFMNEGTGFIFGTKDTTEAILMTEDSCINWELKYLGNKNMFINKGYMLDSLIGFATGDIGGIFKTGDAGNSWLLEPRISSEDINDICFPIYNDTVKVLYACGNKGNVLKYIDIVGINDENERVHEEFVLGLKFPKKLNNIIFNIIISNILGETIIEKNKIDFYNFQEILTSLKAGFYFITIYDDNGFYYNLKFLR